ncbi:hypothetical protein ATANTOWER_014447 [Ataeniobius toweri]|uniref:Uncharacterized protein n=1 Tax=Ataeniobius toweri TaxID=208326 RepID=A0ABU7CIZ0_9TELE|nr:hypothetical protein [Ataeniobius toweri]
MLHEKCHKGIQKRDFFLLKHSEASSGKKTTCGCDRQVLRRSCCSSASNHLGSKGVEIQKEASARYLTSMMNVEIQASKNLGRKSPFCLPPGPGFWK